MKMWKNKQDYRNVGDMILAPNYSCVIIALHATEYTELKYEFMVEQMFKTLPMLSKRLGDTMLLKLSDKGGVIEMQFDLRLSPKFPDSIC